METRGITRRARSGAILLAVVLGVSPCLITRAGDAGPAPVQGRKAAAHADYDPIHGGRIPAPPPETFDAWRGRVQDLLLKLQ